MQIEIRGAKKKDRLVPLTVPGKYFGCIISSTNRICIYSTVNLVYNTQITAATIVKKIHRQTIPHAHLAPQCSNRTIRKGTDLKLIGDLLGHSSRKTTEIYTHTSSKSLQSYTQSDYGFP
jgi:integrase/recombinase XerD